MSWLTDAGMLSVTVGMCILGGDFLRQVFRSRHALGESPSPLETFADLTLPLGVAAIGLAPLTITLIERWALPIPLAIPLCIVAFLLFGAWHHANHALWNRRSCRAMRLRTREAIAEAEAVLLPTHSLPLPALEYAAWTEDSTTTQKVGERA
jgi:hypothetical protein